MTKAKLKVKIVNCQTGEETIEDASAAQIAEFESIAEQKATDQIEAEAKAAQRQSILDKLGLTADEAKLLIG